MAMFLEEIEDSIIDYCIHEYCCRIVQRMFESCHESYLANCISIIMDNFHFLASNEFGIFVLSAMLQKCSTQVKH